MAKNNDPNPLVFSCKLLEHFKVLAQQYRKNVHFLRMFWTLSTVTALVSWI